MACDDKSANPRRIMIIGGSGCGKSTLALAVGQLCNLPVIHMDPFYFRPGWQQRPSSETSALSLEAIKAEEWVFEGNHTNTFAERAERADAIIFIDLGRGLRLWRAVKRWARYRGNTRPDMAQDCPEQMTFEFIKWVWDYPNAGRVRALRFKERWKDKRVFVHLKSRRDVAGFLDRLALDPTMAGLTKASEFQEQAI